MAHQAPATDPATVPLPTRQEIRLNQTDPNSAASHLRLVWPQWQGAGTESIQVGLSVLSPDALRFNSAPLLD